MSSEIDPITNYILIEDKILKEYPVIDKKTLHEFMEFVTIQQLPFSSKYIAGITGSENQLILAGGILAALLIRAYWRWMKDHFATEIRKCAHIKHGTKERKACEVREMNKVRRETIKRLQASMKLCSKTKNSEKCKSKIKDRIKKIEDRIKSGKGF
jgi:hypothetical protein